MFAIAPRGSISLSRWDFESEEAPIVNVFWLLFEVRTQNSFDYYWSMPIVMKEEHTIYNFVVLYNSNCWYLLKELYF